MLRNIISIFQAPGVQVVALVPVAGPVPPPSRVVRPEAMASSICWGQMKCTVYAAFREDLLRVQVGRQDTTNAVEGVQGLHVVLGCGYYFPA